jgi:hypothetical protein
MNISITLFRGLGLGYFKQNVKTILQEDILFDVKVVHYIFLFISIGVYKKTNFRLAI